MDLTPIQWSLKAWNPTRLRVLAQDSDSGEPLKASVRAYVQDPRVLQYQGMSGFGPEVDVYPGSVSLQVSSWKYKPRTVDLENLLPGEEREIRVTLSKAEEAPQLPLDREMIVVGAGSR